MSRMLTEVLRWQRLRQPELPADRWLVWVKSLTSRYQHLPHRPGALPMALAQRLASLYLLCQQWQNSTWQYLQIKLSTGWFDRELVRQEMQSIFPPAIARETAKLVELGERPVRAQLLASSVELGHLHAKPARSKQIRSLTSADTSWQTPSRQVFAGVHQRDRPTVLNQTLLAQATHQILRPSIYERQWIEEMTQRTFVVRQKDLNFTDGKAIAQDFTVGEVNRSAMPLPLGMMHDAGIKTPTSIPPGIDLDLLTEQVIRQIDRRIVAHRERMGKPF